MKIQMMVVDKFRLEFLGSVDGIVARNICSIFYIVERNQDSFTWEKPKYANIFFIQLKESKSQLGVDFGYTRVGNLKGSLSFAGVGEWFGLWTLAFDVPRLAVI